MLLICETATIVRNLYLFYVAALGEKSMDHTPACFCFMESGPPTLFWLLCKGPKDNVAHTVTLRLELKDGKQPLVLNLLIFELSKFIFSLWKGKKECRTLQCTCSKLEMTAKCRPFL